MPLPPTTVNRRHLLSLGAATLLTPTLLSACGRGGAGTSQLSEPTPRPLPVPALLDPPVTAGTRRYDLRMVAARTEFAPDVPTTTWGVNAAYLGPTLRLHRGDNVRMRVTNHLPEETTLHWHGMGLPAAMDGGPHQPIAPDKVWEPFWRVDQAPATLWYHPHLHGQTARHLHRGLAGLIIVDDDGGDRTTGPGGGLPSTYGTDDIPLILQDRAFSAAGRPLEGFGGRYGQMGPDILANGALRAVFVPSTTLVRFRVLNAANARMFHLTWSDRRPFRVAGGDAGLLPAPVTVEEVALSPGERVEMVVEFRPGEQVALRSHDGHQGLDEGDFEVLRCHPGAGLRPSSPVPERLGGPEPVRLPDGAKVRRLELRGTDTINGNQFNRIRVDQVVGAGAREVWEVVNTGQARNFHLHGADFTVLTVDGKPPPAYLAGRKDTVFVPARRIVRLAVKFPSFADARSPYLYHSHVLRDNDGGMAGLYVVVAPGDVATTARVIPEVCGPLPTPA